jgi:hypothetical protein
MKFTQLFILAMLTLTKLTIAPPIVEAAIREATLFPGQCGGGEADCWIINFEESWDILQYDCAI